jgi:hypothetical protein
MSLRLKSFGILHLSVAKYLTNISENFAASIFRVWCKVVSPLESLVTIYQLIRCHISEVWICINTNVITTNPEYWDIYEFGRCCIRGSVINKKISINLKSCLCLSLYHYIRITVSKMSGNYIKIVLLSQISPDVLFDFYVSSWTSCLWRQKTRIKKTVNMLNYILRHEGVILRRFFHTFFTFAIEGY